MRVKTQNNREKSMKLKASSLKKINKIDKSLSRLTKKKYSYFSNYNIRHEKRYITLDLLDIYKIIKKCSEQIYDHKFINLDETDQFLKRYKLPKCTQTNR